MSIYSWRKDFKDFDPAPKIRTQDGRLATCLIVRYYYNYTAWLRLIYSGYELLLLLHLTMTILLKIFNFIDATKDLRQTAKLLVRRQLDVCFSGPRIVLIARIRFYEGVHFPQRLAFFDIHHLLRCSSTAVPDSTIWCFPNYSYWWELDGDQPKPRGLG